MVSIGILASRIVGLVRQKVIAHYFGTTDAADAVAAAFRVGNITQNLLGEAALSASFVPVYARLRLREPTLATRFARALLGVLFVAVVVLSALGALFAPALAAVVAAGFEGDKLALTAELVRILFPMTGVLVLGAWALGILTAHRRFLLPYVAPVLWSVAQIAAVVVAGRGFGIRGDALARALAWGAVGGAGLQLAVMLLPVYRLIGSISPTFERGVEGVGEALARFPSSLAARGVIQISGLVDTFLVSFLGAGANATFQYAQTIYLLPMSVLGTGEAAAALPALAEQDVTSDDARRRVLSSITTSLTRVFTLSLAASVVFAAFGVEVTTLLFRGGSFTASSASDVGAALSAYALGLPANAASRILGTASFARGDTRRPALYATLRVIVSTAVSVALMTRFGVPGVIFGAVVAAWLELALLARNVRATYGGTGLAAVPFGKVVAASIAPAAIGIAAKLGLRAVGAGPFLSSTIILICAGAAFLAAAQFMKLFSIRSLLRRH
ncbi:MAG: murein biosynthesis integral membrane protein MurJ [Polyangiaceae bacterium]|nr:murein biosynthesis integral membrane protein MurJ [Polyangiaceae bacterium]